MIDWSLAWYVVCIGERWKFKTKRSSLLWIFSPNLANSYDTFAKYSRVNFASKYRPWFIASKLSHASSINKLIVSVSDDGLKLLLFRYPDTVALLHLKSVVVRDQGLLNCYGFPIHSDLSRFQVDLQPFLPQRRLQQQQQQQHVIFIYHPILTGYGIHKKWRDLIIFSKIE